MLVPLYSRSNFELRASEFGSSLLLQVSTCCRFTASDFKMPSNTPRSGQFNLNTIMHSPFEAGSQFDSSTP